MNISELFIKRPIMTSLIMAAVLIFGLFAYSLLPVNDLPSIDYPTIQVTSNLPGANPEAGASRNRGENPVNKPLSSRS